MIRYFLFALIIFFQFSCQQKHEKVYRSFYFWKTTMNFSEEENKKLETLNVEKMYTRLFDVDYHNEAVTSGIIDIKALPKNVSIIPVVYITNKTLLNIEDATMLADKISLLVKKIITQHSISINEIQIDCDWTVQTKEKYFNLLKKMKNNFPDELISCTIRLHQIKYPEKTGVPPVQRGMLMFYNMGDINSKTANSIYNEKDAKKYVTFVNKYPIPLDVAIPLFNWIKHFRHGKLIGLINHISPQELRNNDRISETEEGHFTMKENLILHRQFLQSGDNLIIEDLNPGTAIRAAKLVNKYLQSDTCSVIIYHWDKNNPHQHNNTSIEKIYSVFQ